MMSGSAAIGCSRGPLRQLIVIDWLVCVATTTTYPSLKTDGRLMHVLSAGSLALLAARVICSHMHVFDLGGMTRSHLNPFVEGR